MNTIQQIRKGFRYFQTSPQASLTIQESYYWLVKIDGMQGVAIEINSEQQVNESFSKINYYTKTYLINGKEHNLLLLVSEEKALLNDFIYICAAFLEKVLDSDVYLEIQKNPISWWHTMKELLGNANIDKAAYSVLAELMSYYYLLSKEKDIKWTGPFGGSTDLVSSSGESFEVKSTIVRYGSHITINGQYQLRANYLLFFRFEPTNNGLTIQKVVDKLIALGADAYEIEQALTKLKYPIGSEIRNKSYQLLEAKQYVVDKHFPKITPESFIDGQLPPHIINIQYTLDLEGLNSDPIYLKELENI